jgi:hypothetical protein
MTLQRIAPSLHQKCSQPRKSGSVGNRTLQALKMLHTDNWPVISVTLFKYEPSVQTPWTLCLLPCLKDPDDPTSRTNLFQVQAYGCIYGVHGRESPMLTTHRATHYLIISRHPPPGVERICRPSPMPGRTVYST